MLNCMSADHYFRYAMCNNSNISIIKSALYVFALFIIFIVVNNYLPAFTRLTVQGFNKQSSAEGLMVTGRKPQILDKLIY